MTLWLLVVLMGVGTYAIRLSLLALVDYRALPPAARAALRFVTPAVLAAIILPAVAYRGGNGAFDPGFGNERVVAALTAAAVAWLTKSVWLTITAGMVVLWALQAIT
jgi:branched chain amino acid efflux pump